MNLPCILKTTGGHTVCLFENGFGYHLDGCYKGVMTDCKFSIAGSDKNTTTEYLANTYGEVKSKEHAEFIVKLAEVNGINVVKPKIECLGWFSFWDNKLGFFEYEISASQGGCKQIAIPLPPESNVNTPEEDFEMKQIAKNNGDNLIFGDADKCEEWPCVNDEVETSDGNGVVKLLPDSKGYYVVSVNDEYYQYQIDELSKPKTPEQELRDELISEFREIGHSGIVLIGMYDKVVDEFLSKYNVNKKPQ